MPADVNVADQPGHTIAGATRSTHHPGRESFTTAIRQRGTGLGQQVDDRAVLELGADRGRADDHGHQR